MNNKKLGFLFFALAAAILVASCASSVYVFKKHNAESAWFKAQSLAEMHARRLEETLSRFESQLSETVRVAEMETYSEAALAEIPKNASPNAKIPSQSQKPSPESAPWLAMHCSKLTQFSLASAVRTSPSVAGARIWNANGDLACSAGPLLKSSNVADRGYFDQLRSGAADFAVSPPLVSRSSGKWSVVAAKRISYPDGTFAGVAGLIVDLEKVQQRSLVNDAFDPMAKVVAISTADMKAWSSQPGEFIGQRETALLSSSLAQLKNSEPKNSYRIPAQASPEGKIWAAAPVGAFPLVALAELDRDAEMSSWRTVALLTAAAGCATSLLLWLSLGYLRITSNAKSHGQKIDASTGLPNRIGAEELCSKIGKNASLCCAEFDAGDIKSAEDAFGAGALDDFAVLVADRLLVNMPANARLCRSAAGKFMCLMPDADPESASAAVAKLISCLNLPFEFKQQTFIFKARAGYALRSAKDAFKASELPSRAAAALREAARGREPVVLFSEELSAKAQARLGLASKLRKALANPAASGLSLAYQPIYDSKNMQLASFEALARWNPPGEKPISPAEFIPCAEENGLIHDLGNAALRIAVRQLSDWLNAGVHPPPVAVNVSALQILRGDLANIIASELSANNVPAELLRIEITESAAMENHDAGLFMSVLENIKLMGCQILVDDFGTGYSSITRLRDLPADTLKIDRSIVEAISDEPGRELCQATIALAQSLSMKTVGEGVETAEQLEFLANAGCTFIQGYFTGRPP